MLNKFILIPAEYAKDAISFHDLAREDALSEKNKFFEKYNCDLLFRSNDTIKALGWKLKPNSLKGFTKPKYHDVFNVWFMSPEFNTLNGLHALLEFSELGKLLDIWQKFEQDFRGFLCIYFLKTKNPIKLLQCLGVFLVDGQLIINVLLDNINDEVVIPSFAIEISESHAEFLLKSSGTFSTENFDDFVTCSPT